MKNICFIGIFDKLDLILYISKIIKNIGKKVLIIDATTSQKARYIVPTINPTKSYITNFEDIDIAIGFNSYEEVEKYVGFIENHKINYDYIFVDVDNAEVFENFNNEKTIKNYFVTSFESYSIKRGLETIKQIKKPIKITKIVFSNYISKENDYYLDYLALGHKIIWEDNNIYFPYNTADIEATIENQKVYKIRIKNLSQQYKDVLEYTVKDIIPNINTNNLRRIIKNIEKEG